MIVPVSTRIPAVRKVLVHATSEKKVDSVYQQYIDLPSHRLLTFFKIEDAIGVIGLKHSDEVCEIGHIAVSPDKRGMGYGSCMIHYVCHHFTFTRLIAETDGAAVDFYRRYGFEITSLREKCPGVERFHCEYKKEV